MSATVKIVPSHWGWLGVQAAAGFVIVTDVPVALHKFKQISKIKD